MITLKADVTWGSYLLWKRPFLFLRVNSFSFYPRNYKIEQCFFQFTSLAGRVPFSPASLAHRTVLSSLWFHHLDTKRCGFGMGILNKFMKAWHRVEESSCHQEVSKHICCLGYNHHPSGSALEMAGNIPQGEWVALQAHWLQSGLFWLLTNQRGWCKWLLVSFEMSSAHVHVHAHTRTQNACLSSLCQAIANLKVLPAAFPLKEKSVTQRKLCLTSSSTLCTQIGWRNHQKTLKPTFLLEVSIHTSACSSW